MTLMNTTKLGIIRITPSDGIVAGMFGTWKIIYEAGEEGLDPGGGFRINSNLWGFFLPQFSHPAFPGYVTFKTSSPDSHLICVSGDYNPSVEFKLHGSPLMKGESIHIVYGDTSDGNNPEAEGEVNIAAGEKITFEVWVDASGSGNYKKISGLPEVTVVAGKAKSLHVWGSSNQVIGQSFRLNISALDENHNFVNSYSGGVNVKYLDIQCRDNKKDYIMSCHKGIGYLNMTPEHEGICRVEVSDPDIGKCDSNPISIDLKSSVMKLYWGDIHGHSNMSDGRGSVDAYYSYARDVAGLDFCALTDHSEDMTDKDWEYMQEKNSYYNETGIFVTINAYEWTSWKEGHRCIYYRNGCREILSSNDKRSNTLHKLWEHMDDRCVFTIPHHPAGLGLGSEPGAVNWDVHNEKLEPLVEVFSSHGNFEYMGCPENKINGLRCGSFVQDALSRGYIMGMIASSDSHDGHPGLTGQYFYHRRSMRGLSKGCLVGVYAEKFTREDIWQSLKSRHCYATTGKRIILYFEVNGSPMGKEIYISDNGAAVNIKGYAAGTDRIEKIDIVKNNEVIFTKFGRCSEEKIEYVDNGTNKTRSFYYLRVLQADGEMALSSPVWCKVGI